MRELATALGVSPMTPYRYFKDKGAILAAVRARGFNRHADVLEQAYAETKGDVAQRAQAVGRAYVRFAFDNPEAYKLMFDISQPDEGDYPGLMEAAERSRRTMTRHLEEMADVGRLAGDPFLIGHIYWAAIHGPLMLHFSHKLPPRYEARRLIGKLVEVLNGHFFGAA